MPPELEYEVYSGAAGEGFAAEFLGFLRIFRTMPNPDVIMLNPQSADVPSDPATLYAIVGALSRKMTEATADRLFTYYNRLPSEYGILAVRDSMQVCPTAANTRAFIDWANRNSDFIL